MEFKEIYHFTVHQAVEKTVETVSKDEQGNEVKTSRKVSEKSPIKVFLKRPSRRQIEEADLEYSVEMSRCVKKGILTKAMLVKKYSDTGGLMSETEAKTLYQNYQKLLELQREYTENETVNKTEDSRKKKSEDLGFAMAQVRDQIVKTEMAYQSLFDHTADMKAQNRIILWYIINLTYIQKEGEDKPTPYFKGEEFEDRLEDYYEKEEGEDTLYFEIARKVSNIAAFWFYNQTSTPEEFDKLFESKGDAEEVKEDTSSAAKDEAPPQKRKRKSA